MQIKDIHSKLIRSTSSFKWLLVINHSNIVLDIALGILVLIGLVLVSRNSYELNNSLVFGTHTLSLMYPLVFSLFYVFLCAYLGRFNKFRAFQSIALFIIICLPLIPFLNNTISHISWDDGFRNSVYAKNILANKTLWGSDELVWGAREIHKGKLIYIDLPGYRYWLALTISIFKGETRGMQIFNLLIVLLVTLGFLLTSKERIGKINLSKFTLFISLSSAYLAKNVLQGMTEWLTLSLFLLFIIFFLLDLPLIATINLGLIPFVRQNLLIFCFILMFLLVIHFRKKFLIIPFIVTIGLPVYHNVYFAGKYQLLVNSLNWAESTTNYNGNASTYLFSFLLRSLEYIGFEPNTNILALSLAWLFVPFATVLIISELANLEGKSFILLFTLISSLVLPTLFYGNYYYPRFVFLNQSLSLISIFIFSNTKLLHLNSKKYHA